MAGGSSNPLATSAAVRYAGETVPDIVGVLRYDQAWGSAQLSAAHNVNQAATALPIGVSRNMDTFSVHMRIERDF